MRAGERQGWSLWFSSGKRRQADSFRNRRERRDKWKEERRRKRKTTHNFQGFKMPEVAVNVLKGMDNYRTICLGGQLISMSIGSKFIVQTFCEVRLNYMNLTNEVRAPGIWILPNYRDLWQLTIGSRWLWAESLSEWEHDSGGTDPLNMGTEVWEEWISVQGSLTSSRELSKNGRWVGYGKLTGMVQDIEFQWSWVKR